MKKYLLTIALVVANPMVAIAQSVLTTDTAPAFKFCSDRPAEPQMVQNMPMRDAHKRILVQRMYTSNALQSVVETNDCSCANRFPAWDFTLEQYLETYGGLTERFEVLEVTSQVRRNANEYRKLARPICVEEGNW